VVTLEKLILLVAIVGIIIIECYAISKGMNGAFMAAAVGGLCTIAGIFADHIYKVKKLYYKNSELHDAK
jgi:hypothetical protein